MVTMPLKQYCSAGIIIFCSLPWAWRSSSFQDAPSLLIVYLECSSGQKASWWSPSWSSLLLGACMRAASSKIKKYILFFAHTHTSKLSSLRLYWKQERNGCTEINQFLPLLDPTRLKTGTFRGWPCTVLTRSGIGILQKLHIKFTPIGFWIKPASHLKWRARFGEFGRRISFVESQNWLETHLPSSSFWRR